MSKIKYILLTVLSTTFAFAADGAIAAIGAGMVVIGAGVGIGLFASAAAHATARQPEAANDIRSTVNLPLFLLEGVAIIGLVVCILVVVL